MKYINILVPLDQNRMGVNGEVYPFSGFITSKNFLDNDDLRNGFSGILEGNCSKYFLKWLDQKIWVVIRTENKNIVTVDYYNNIIKFKNGLILYSGNLSSSLNYIKNYIKNVEV